MKNRGDIAVRTPSILARLREENETLRRRNEALRVGNARLLADLEAQKNPGGAAGVKSEEPLSQMPDIPRHRVLDAKWDGLNTFKVEEAGEILRASRGQAYAMVLSGALPAFRFGKLWRITRRTLEDLLEGEAIAAARKRQPERRGDDGRAPRER